MALTKENNNDTYNTYDVCNSPMSNFYNIKYDIIWMIWYFTLPYNTILSTQLQKKCNLYIKVLNILYLILN